MSKKIVIDLDKFKPRDYQVPLFKALEDDGYKRLMAIWPRRCLSGDTHITMANGSWKLLRDIKVGDKILSWNGSFFEPDIVKNAWKTGIKPTKKVQSYGHLPVYTSHDHKFASLTQGKDVLSWSSASTIRPQRQVLTYGGIGFGAVHNPNLAEFIGYMSSDGYCSGYQQPKFTNTNLLILNRVADLSNRLFGYIPVWREKGKAWDLGFTNGTRGGGSFKNKIKQLFRDYGQDVPKSKSRLLPHVWSFDETSLLRFFAAVISSDGSMYCHKDDRIGDRNRFIPAANELTISCGMSDSLAWDYYWLLRKIGVVPQVPYKERGSNWKIKISKGCDLKLILSGGPIYGKEDKQGFILARLPNKPYKAPLWNDCWRRKVKVLDAEPEELYDIETENHHTFVANGYVVHNSGKDMTAWNLCIRELLRSPKTIYYVFPTFSSGRRILWDSLSNDGFRIIDYLPKELVESRNEQLMRIRLANGSVFQIIGSDSYDSSLIGTNPQMVVFSEFALSDPMAYQFVRPILNANKGIALIVSCVAPDTLVIGENGLQRIKNVSNNRDEYSDLNVPIYGLGGFHNAEQFYCGGKQKTLKITLAAGYELECTPIHPIWNGREWVKAKDLKVGDEIPVQYGQDVWGKGLDILNEFFYERKCRNIKYRELIIDYDSDDFFYLLGLIHADGHLAKGLVAISNKKDKQIIDFLNSFGFSTGEGGRLHSFYSHEFCALLDLIGFKKGNVNKVFPEFLFLCNKGQMRAFLQGIFDGNGHSHSDKKKSGRITYTSTCLKFMKDLQVVLLNFGIASLFRTQKPSKGTKNAVHQLEIGGYFAHVFYRDIGFRLNRKQSGWENISDRAREESWNTYPTDPSRLEGYKVPKDSLVNRSRIKRVTIKRLSVSHPHPYLDELLKEKFFYSSVKSIEKSTNKVYDFVIPDTHSFFSNGFVSHNTPRGKNAMYDMYQAALQNPEDWFVSHLTVEDTKHISLEDIMRERELGEMSEDLQRQEYWCFPGDTGILTPFDVRPIKDIKKDDLVFAHSGRVRRVLETIERCYSGEMIEISSYGSYESLICTPNHPIRTYKQEGAIHEWIPASELTLEHKVVFPKKRLVGNPVISHELCMLMAWYITEGSSFNNGLQFSVGNNSEVERVVGLLTKLGHGYKVYTRDIDNGIDIVVNSVQLIDFFRSNCGSLSCDRRIPFSLIAGHESEFFDELIVGDGCDSTHRGYRRLVYTTISKTLAYHIQFLAHTLSCGYAAGITRTKAYVGVICGRSVNCAESYTINISIGSGKRNHSWLHRAKYCVAAKIKSIRKFDFIGSVYNLKVQYDESYVANGRAVHNCDFSLGVEGGYYTKYIDRLRLNNQIGRVSWEPQHPVHTAWDIGVRDSTAIIFFQIVGQSIHVIDFYEKNKEGLEHYVNILKDKPYTYGKHIGPHDIRNMEFSSGITRWEKARQLGITFEVADRLSIMDGIEAVRTTLPRMWFDEVRCKSLIKAVENYRQEYDSKKKIYKATPLHDIHSHASDAIRYLAISLPKLRTNMTPDDIEKMRKEAQYGNQENLPPFFR
jgi:intein/homing endonuclease